MLEREPPHPQLYNETSSSDKSLLDDCLRLESPIARQAGLQPLYYNPRLRCTRVREFLQRSFGDHDER